ncbi:F-box/LRR-repeat protein 13 [Phytophthora nicotianae]|uniref:F-box/LRR-repeat protein 13 n=1 Tax=Phytophthora nicotianae TaxID=4792 RepID=A0A0W8DAX7_PHYNI|nr:F-box/LRR-repeat protein 13 [Phytophthora nicotianae]
MNFTNKDICSLLFTEETPNKAKCCVCGKIYKQGNGYTNQMHHLLKMHPDYPRLAKAAFRRGNPLGLTMADQRTNEIFRSIEWCVLDRMPQRRHSGESSSFQVISRVGLQEGPCYALPTATHVSRVGSTHVERVRAFLQSSQAGLTDLRKAMDPNTLEVLMFLSYNKDWWDAF